jgi:carboxyl-terminal processing protease
MFLQLPRMMAKQDVVLHTYSALVEVDALARQQFVEPIEGDRLVDGAIRGLLLQLDPYSGYIAPNELPSFLRHSRGDYSGIGIEVGIQDDQLIVIAPIEGSPAAKAGVLAGDAILAIDGQEIKGHSVFEVEELISGPPGTAVRFRVRHEGQRDPEALTIVRGPVNLVTIRGFRRNASGQWEYLIDPDRRIGYVRVSSFRNNTVRSFNAALDRLLEQRMRGLIIDLRFNPGGLMHQGIAVADRFIDSDVIVSTVTRRKAVQEYLATSRDTIRDVALVVLINRASASASEIIAGALQARLRATIVGERSFGKGSVQQLIELTEHNAAIKLTTAYYRLPDGRIIHRTAANAHSDTWGVIPDVEVVLRDEETQAVQASRRALDVDFAESAHLGAEGTAISSQSAEVHPREILRDRQLLEGLLQLRLKLREDRSFHDS